MVFEVSAAAYIAEVPSYIPVVNHRFVRTVPQQQEKELALWKCACTHTFIHKSPKGSQYAKLRASFKSYQKDITFKECYLHLLKYIFESRIFDTPEYIHTYMSVYMPHGNTCCVCLYVTQKYMYVIYMTCSTSSSFKILWHIILSHIPSWNFHWIICIEDTPIRYCCLSDGNREFIKTFLAFLVQSP